MKPLILILLTAAWVQAQSVADVARQERARQAKTPDSVWTFKTSDIKAPTPAREQVTDEAAANPETPGTSAAAASPAPPAPVVSPQQQWQEDTAKLRTKIRELMDQELALQLDINASAIQATAPVTNTTARAEAQAKLESAQTRLTVVRDELGRSRVELQQREAQIPPK